MLLISHTEVAQHLGCWLAHGRDSMCWFTLSMTMHHCLSRYVCVHPFISQVIFLCTWYPDNFLIILASLDMLGPYNFHSSQWYTTAHCLRQPLAACSLILEVTVSWFMTAGAFFSVVSSTLWSSATVQPIAAAWYWSDPAAIMGIPRLLRPQHSLCLSDCLSCSGSSLAPVIEPANTRCLVNMHHNC